MPNSLAARRIRIAISPRFRARSLRTRSNHYPVSGSIFGQIPGHPRLVSEEEKRCEVLNLRSLCCRLASRSLGLLTGCIDVGDWGDSEALQGGFSPHVSAERGRHDVRGDLQRVDRADGVGTKFGGSQRYQVRQLHEARDRYQSGSMSALRRDRCALRARRRPISTTTWACDLPSACHTMRCWS